MDPLEHAKRLFFEALSCQEQGDLRAAERLYEEALALAPDRPSIMNNLAVVYIKSGKYLPARQLCERCLAIDPNDRHALVHLGICLVKSNEATDALSAFDAALALQPDDPRVLANRAGALLQLNRFDDAVEESERALSIEGDLPDALNVLGNTLLKLGRTEEALASFRRALASQPDHDETLFNLAATLLRSGQEGEANELFRHAVDLRPDEAQRRSNFADALRMQHLLPESIEQYEAALALDPNDAQARYGLGGARLLRQEYRSGWEDYESRLQAPEFRKESFRREAASVVRFEERPRWQGPEHAVSCKVAVWAEQGIGDEVLFSTLIPELVQTHNAFVYEIDERLLAAYRHAFPGVGFVARSDPPNVQLLNADCVIAAGSLPRFFRTSPEAFARQPAHLVRAVRERVTYYRNELAKLGDGIKVALSWHSARDHWWARRKNIALSALSPILQLPGARFIDVQYGNTDDERSRVEAATGVRIKRFQSVDHLRDLEELMAILEACDLVITTSNATAHLAGALGKRTWILFPGDRPPFHYWAHRGDYRSPWYPSVEIVSTPERDDWTSVIQSVREKLSRSI